MKTYRITHYTDRHGIEKWRVEYKWLGFWIRVQRPYELADGMTDPFSRDEAMRLIERHSGKKIKEHSQEQVTV